MAHRKVYTPEFKHHAVGLAQQPGNTNQVIASDLGISQSALSSWILSGLPDQLEGGNDSSIIGATFFWKPAT